MATAQSNDGVEIYYETWGRGTDSPPLLLISGLGADLRIWACQRLVFGLRHRCIALDNRGAGRSGRPPGPYTLAQMADDALSVLDAEGVGEAHVVAYSMGSLSAQILAGEHPERVRSLILAGSAARHHPWRRDLLAGWADLAADRGMHVMAREAFPWLVGPRSARRFRVWLNALWPLVLSQPADAFGAQVDAILSGDDGAEARNRLATITAPTLVLAGAQDQLMPPADGAELAACIPGARFNTIGGAGHGLMLEAAAEFNAAVLEFLASVPATIPALTR